MLYQVAELISFSGKFCLSALNIELSLLRVASIKRLEDVTHDEVKHDSACSELTSASTWCDKDFDWLSPLTITSLIWRSFSISDIWWKQTILTHCLIFYSLSKYMLKSAFVSATRLSVLVVGLFVFGTIFLDNCDVWRLHSHLCIISNW